jgi:hypothetical protein
MTLGVEDAVVQQPGWPEQLRRTWLALCQLSRPFYGDVRTLTGYRRSRNGALWIGPETERHPVKAWWWRGLPTTIGHAAVLGPPYAELWPSFKEAAEEIDGFWFLSKSDWTGSEDVAQLVGGVPDRLKAPDEPPEMVNGAPAELIERPREEDYARVWPFPKPPSP